jgi:soluble lytic murein transglycosylase
MKKLIVVVLSCLLTVVLFISLLYYLFPQKYRAEIEKYSALYNLPKSCVASVINIESRYDPNVVSNAGAMGIMQLLPSTAFDCADRLGIDIEEKQLFVVETNIMLGCFYLRYLLDQFDGNWINSLAAYNWGYGNVRDWIAIGNVSEDGTIINIPAKETKQYLKKYKVCRFVYEKIYNY